MTAPGGFTAGDVLSAADMNALPGGVIGFAIRTTQLAENISTEQDAPDLTFTFTAVAGRLYVVQAAVAASVGASSAPFCKIYQGATLLKNTLTLVGAASNLSLYTATPPMTFTAGTVTVKVRIGTEAGNATFAASTDDPSYISVADVGKAP